jgi:large subunit ribosomal protein L23
VKSNRIVLIRPLITEKAEDLKESERKVGFLVDPSANKIEIRKAVEKRFNVKVEKVTTTRVMGKTKRMGRNEGRRPDFKKALVKLKEGFKIEFFEGK